MEALACLQMRGYYGEWGKPGKLTRYGTETADPCHTTDVTLWQIVVRRTLPMAAETTGCSKEAQTE